MRAVVASVLVVGVSAGLCVSANAATAHRSHVRSHITVDSGQNAAARSAPGGNSRLAVPGWSDDDTRRWMDNASALWRGA
jgi:hypothetical protein